MKKLDLSSKKNLKLYFKFSPRYQSMVRGYARLVWANKATDSDRIKFFKRLEKFKNMYQRNLEIIYKNVNIHPGTIEAKANQWLSDQKHLILNIHTIAESKKTNLKEALIKQLNQPRGISPEKIKRVQEQVDTLYLSPEERREQNVSYVKSFDLAKIFKKHEKNFNTEMKRRINQLADQEIFDLSKDVNETVIKKETNTYTWMTMGDSKVRKTHAKFANKHFSFDDHPTSIYKSGRRFTGPPGTDYGCRCWMIPGGEGKVFKNYSAKE